MKTTPIIKKSILLALLYVLMACGATEKPGEQDKRNLIHSGNAAMIAEASEIIQSGDLILRTGSDFSSEQIKRFSKKDKTYSHAGIAVIDSGITFVYHIEPDFKKINNRVRIEKLDSFCNPAVNIGFGIARYKMGHDERDEFLNYLKEQYINQVVFDMNFDLTTNDEMYCSEMIKKGLFYATNGKIIIEADRLNDKSKYKLIKQYFGVKEERFANMEIIPIDHLFLNPHCTMIKEFVFDK